MAAAKAAGIVVEAYSLLMCVLPYYLRIKHILMIFSSRNNLNVRPITHQPGGPLDKPLARISERLGATTDQVLMAWARSKGVVVVT